ncbi:MAG: hypothetical protein JWP36_506 [Paucimonas sp.]|nr:hypothetical protein [Paucimonas sp.]
MPLRVPGAASLQPVSVRMFFFRLRLLSLALALALAPATQAAPLARAAGQAGALAITFLPVDLGTRSMAGGDAVVDLGPLSASQAGRRNQPILVRRRVAIRIDGGSGAAASARLSVALANDMPGSTVRVDGLALSTIPRVISPVHRIGSVVVHEVEMTIPASVPAGAFHHDLQWIAESD